jgi:murein L,D-transpeptidase YcbB/YkuD
MEAVDAGGLEAALREQAERADRLAGRTARTLRARLSELYAGTGGTALWLDGGCRPNGDARAALARLAAAAEDGLDPADYGTAELVVAAEALEDVACAGAGQRAAFEIGLTTAVLYYLQELHEGRVDPRSSGFRMAARTVHPDYAGALREAAAGHAVGALATAFQPQIDQYGALRAMLARYRRLATEPPAALPAPERGARAVRPGDPYPLLPEMQRLLVALGDLPQESPPPADGLYGGELVEGVQRFQSRHGLAADGILGPQTLAAMAVPMAARARQIELALERLRWLPPLSPDGFAVVNIPAFRLLAWGPARAGATAGRRGPPALSMAVIVGRAFDRETPVVVDVIEEVVFRPYWYVPASIVRGEILPELRLDPQYLSRNDMEIFRGSGEEAVVVEAGPESLDLLGTGELRLRQRPGPANALGLVKLAVPRENVYLHDTPAPELFERSRRDFSHGCVRVEDPVALAEWALAGEEGWDRRRITAAMNGSDQLRVRLRRPVQVVLFYVTAIVRPQDHAIHFFTDVYGHDRRLEQALGERAAAMAASVPPGEAGASA